MTNNIHDILQKARKMEIDGRELYEKARDSATSEMAKRFFDSLAQDEKRHLSMVEKMGKGMGVDVDNMPLPAERIRTVFSEISSREVSELAATAEDQDALEMALKMEKDSYDLYARAAGLADSDATKQLLERLKQEENQHYEMLRNTEEYLKDNKQWFLTQEDALLTGDMSSLG